MKRFFSAILLFFSLEALADDVQPVNVFNAAGESFADNKKFFGDIITDLNYWDNYDSDDRLDNNSETNIRARFLAGFQINKKLSLNTQIHFAPLYKASKNNNGGDRFFEDQALILRELYLKYVEEKYTLIAGKANLGYGTAWYWNRGIWTYDLATNYRQVGKIAVGGVYHLGNNKTTGQYNFGFSFFKNDRKYMDNTLIASADSVYKSNATPGDDGFFKSYIATLDIKFDFGVKEKLSYHFGYINLGVNNRFSTAPIDSRKDQKGFVLGMNYQYPVIKNYDVDALVEYSKMNNLQGNSNYNEHYFTASLINHIYNHWNVTLGYALHESNLLQFNGFDQEIKELSFGYEFSKTSYFDRLLIQLGYKAMRNDYQSYQRNNDAVGILLRYYKNF